MSMSPFLGFSAQVPVVGQRFGIALGHQHIGGQHGRGNVNNHSNSPSTVPVPLTCDVNQAKAQVLNVDFHNVGLLEHPQRPVLLMVASANSRETAVALGDMATLAAQFHERLYTAFLDITNEPLLARLGLDPATDRRYYLYKPQQASRTQKDLPSQEGAQDLDSLRHFLTRQKISPTTRYEA
ncbi:MAG: hypothetical protein SFZ03_07900 [Candidatus Melainabacteria bacterium]|nr:hypothetical protein [Candidatus Melainabacteria bacterium]